MTRIIPAVEPAEIEIVRTLFREYADSLEVDLCCYGFEQELARLPGDYASPAGRLYLAYVDEIPAACVAMRKISEGICEMKRLYVRPANRGLGLGRRLVEKLIDDARSLGYSKMRLDTLPSLHPARELYRSLGFKSIAPYHSKPIPGALYFELDIL